MAAEVEVFPISLKATGTSLETICEASDHVLEDGGAFPACSFPVSRAAGWEVRIIKALEVHVENHRTMLLASGHLPLNLCVQQKVTSKLPTLLC